MKRNLKISVSNKPQNSGVVTCRNVSIRERLLRFFFGRKQKVTILIPGDSIEKVSISEMKGGGEDEQDGIDS